MRDVTDDFSTARKTMLRSSKTFCASSLSSDLENKTKVLAVLASTLENAWFFSLKRATDCVPSVCGCVCVCVMSGHWKLLCDTVPR